VIVYQTLKNWQFAEIEHRYTAEDSMFYAPFSKSARRASTPERTLQ